MDVLLLKVLLSILCVVFSSILFLPKLKSYYYKHRHFSRLFNSIPGPKTHPLIGDVLGFLLIPQNAFLVYIGELARTYNSFFRIWIGPFRGTVHISSWKYAENIFNSNKHIEKNSVYTFLHPWLGTGLLTSSGSKWHTRRKLLTPAFHRSVLDNYQEIFLEKSVKLIEKLQVKCGTKFDIAPYIWKCSLDIICGHCLLCAGKYDIFYCLLTFIGETSMGTKMNIQDGKNVAYFDAIESVSKLTLWRFVRPWLHPKFLFDISPSGRKFNHSVKVMDDFSNKIIKSRREMHLKSKISNINLHLENHNEFEMESKKRKTFIDILIEAANSEDQKNKPIMSDDDIREEVNTFMFEGHDTTASGISWTLYLLGRHPEIQEKVVQELNEVLGSERATTTQKLSELRLLERCIRESLRLYPSVPIIARKLREDVKLGDVFVPAESEIVIHVYFLHRDPKIFPDPDKFNPDNFLPEVCENRPPFSFVPFSAGSRNCIGQKFAMQESKTVVATILQNYHVESIDSPEDLKLLPELILRSENGINLRIYRRK